MSVLSLSLPLQSRLSALVAASIGAMATISVLTFSAHGQAPALVGNTWKLSPEPVLRIALEKSLAGKSASIVGLTRSESGEIAIADAESRQIRIFDAKGTFARAFGRKGAAKDEFEQLSWIGRTGDTLHVFDSQASRASMYNIRDGFLNSRLLPSTSHSALQVGARFSNGDFLVWERKANPHSWNELPDSARLGVVPVTPPDSIRWGGTFAFHDHSAHITRASHWFVWGNLLWINDRSSSELLLIDKAGKLSSKVQVPLTAKPGEPAITQFFVTPDHQLWIEQFQSDSPLPRECVVITRFGNVVARLTIPANFDTKEVGSDYVLGIQRNSATTESIVMYRIWK